MTTPDDSPHERPDPSDPFIHATAVVDDGARLGPGTKVWHHAHIRTGAQIGDGCTIGKNVYVDEGVSVGSRCKVQNNVSLYAGVTLDDEVFVGPSAVFTNDRHPRATGEWRVIPTRVRRGASIGANATIVCGVEIGEWAAIAAGAVVTRTVVPHELVAGNPARRLGWVCQCGHTVERTTSKRTVDQCPECGWSFT